MMFTGRWCNGWLLNNTSNNVKVEIAEESRVNLGLDEWAVEFAFRSYGIGDLQAFFCSDFQNFRNGLFFRSGGRLNFNTAGANRIAVLNLIVGDGEMHVYRVEHDQTGEWRAYRDGELVDSGVYAASGLMRCKDFFDWGDGNKSQSPSSFELEYFKIEGWNHDETWNPSLSGGSGDVLPSASGLRDGQLVRYAVDGTQWVPWLYYDSSDLPANHYRVGLGWSPSIRDYDYYHSWRDNAPIDYAVHNTLICRGEVWPSGWISGGTEITGNFLQGLLITGDVPYDGSNKNELAFAETTISATVSNITVRWFRIYPTTTTLASSNISGAASNSFFEECYIAKAPGRTTSPLTASGAGTNRGFRRCTIDFGGLDIGYATGWATNVSFYGCILYGYKVTAIQSTGSSGDRHATDNWAVEGTGSDFNIPNFSTNDNNASADNTGQYTGYGKNEFVDFDGGDYRIKSTSDLVALGIGAFYEEQPAGPIEYEGTISVTASVSINMLSNKVARGQPSIVSDASINLLSNKRAMGYPAATSTADIHLSSNKQASGDAGITAAAQMQVTAAKLATASVTLDAIASTSLAGIKIAAAAASIPATATGFLFGSKCASSAISFDINASATALGSKLAWGSFDVPVSISVSISGSSDMEIPAAPAAKVVFITSQSFTRHQVATQSKRHIHITGGSRA